MSRFSAWIPRTSTVDMVAPHTPVQCASLLRAAIDSEWSAAITLLPSASAKPVVGKASESKLRLRKRIGYRNSFQSYLRASMQRSAEGTVISGTVGMNPLVPVIMGIWFAAVILIGGAAFFRTVSSMLSGASNLQQNAWIGIVGPLTMVTFGVGIVGGGLYGARDEARFLTDFLATTLHARDRTALRDDRPESTRLRAPRFS